MDNGEESEAMDISDDDDACEVVVEDNDNEQSKVQETDKHNVATEETDNNSLKIEDTENKQPSLGDANGQNSNTGSISVQTEIVNTQDGGIVDTNDMKEDYNNAQGDTTEMTDSKKRKAEDPLDVPAKKPRVMPVLSDAVLQRIFTLLPPAMLFRCLRVNKHFNKLLTNAKAEILRGRGRPAISTIDSESIWNISRRTTYPMLPRPLLGHSEQQMLRLITGRTCQSCHRLRQQIPIGTALIRPTDPHGAYAVRPIWSFGTITCGPCLKSNSLTDVELLKEKWELSAYALKRGLAYTFFTQDLCVLSEANARAFTGPGVSKVFWLQDITKLIAEYRDAKQYGVGAAEEWLKGLDDMGKQANIDALRWQRWEDSLPYGTVLADYMRSQDIPSFQREPIAIPTLPAQPLPRPGIPRKEVQLPPRPRNQDEVQQIKLERKSDIERRCAQLMPPITPGVLQYSEAYTAACQIVMPLTESAWDLLRPRIEKDREDAERIHYEKTQQMALLRAAMPLHYQPQGQKVEIDPEWESARGPLRRKLAEYADDYINSKWLRVPLDADNVPTFAAEVLSTAHRRYLESPDATSLALHDLKWLFDQKVRGACEKIRRDMFVCSGCYDDNRDVKWCSFESLIQHYGAKHTTEFSQGNVVVCWPSAPWPEELPFLVDLSKIMAARQPRRVRMPHQPVERDTRFDTSPKSKSPIDTMAEEDRINILTAALADVWSSLRDVRGLYESVRIQTALYHAKVMLDQKYGAQYQANLAPPIAYPIETLTQALVTRAELAEFKTVSKLACRFCQPVPGGSLRYTERLGKKPLYTLAQLLTHYKLHHSAQSWLNTIEVPEQAVMRDFLREPGMNDAKLALIDAAFPGVFPRPLPIIGEVPEPEPDSGLAARLVNKSVTKPKSKKKKNHAAAPKPGEYDPRNPSDVKPVFDLSKFDTDAGRPKATPNDKNSNGISIAPETLKALQSISAALPVNEAQKSEVKTQPYSSNPVSSTPAAAPDIAAIIASLTGGSTSTPSHAGVLPHSQSATNYPAQAVNYTNSGTPADLSYLAKPTNHAYESRSATRLPAQEATHQSNARPADLSYIGKALDQVYASQPASQSTSYSAQPSNQPYSAHSFPITASYQAARTNSVPRADPPGHTSTPAAYPARESSTGYAGSHATFANSPPKQYFSTANYTTPAPAMPAVAHAYNNGVQQSKSGQDLLAALSQHRMAQPTYTPDYPAVGAYPAHPSMPTTYGQPSMMAYNPPQTSSNYNPAQPSYRYEQQMQPIHQPAQPVQYRYEDGYTSYVPNQSIQQQIAPQYQVQPGMANQPQGQPAQGQRVIYVDEYGRQFIPVDRDTFTT